jgi:RNA polymerase sigma factor (sigma-70 family)
MNKITDRDKPIDANALPDNEIITRILKGEKDFYALILRKYNQRLYRVAMSILNDESEAEDAMQVAYINAYDNLGKFAFKSAFSTWLTRILINECLLRLKKRTRSVSMDSEMINNEFYKFDTTNVQTPFMKTINNELKQALEVAIRQLPEKYRTVFVMREVEGMNVAETKDCLQISEVNVKVRLNRAKSLLRDSLSVYYKNEDILHFHLTRCDKMVGLVMEQIQAY